MRLFSLFSGRARRTNTFECKSGAIVEAASDKETVVGADTRSEKMT